MPTLLELQKAIYSSLIAGDDRPAAQLIVSDELVAEERLNIYRNTFIGTLTTALRLSYPAVHRLVGAEFFESATRIFIEGNPPRSAYLDLYGADFPEFLERFPPAASLPYLPGIARLEWAVTGALHAPDAKALDADRVAELPAFDPGRVRLVPHPSIALVNAEYPVDTIWRAVVAQDDPALARLDLKTGPVWLLVERLDMDINVIRISEPAWRFMSALCAPQSLEDAIDAADSLDACAVLAEHLAAGRFVGFRLIDGAPRLAEATL